VRYVELPVSARLDPFVESLWLLEDAPAAGPREPRPIYPDGHVELIFNLGDPTAELRAGEAPRPQSRALLAGQLEGPVLVAAGSRLSLLGVRFRPEGAAAFAGLPLRELVGRVAPLEEVAGGWAGELLERLGNAPRDAASLLQDALARKLSGAAAPPTSLRAAVAAIGRSNGAATMDAVARAAGVSTRELQRGFARWVGLSPKRFARIVRFQSVLRADDATWAEVAVACGYYDQAHLIRDFRELAGEVPTRVKSGFDGLSSAFALRASHSSKTVTQDAARLQSRRNE